MATVTVAATPQVGIDDNVGGVSGTVPSVAVTLGETLLVVAINRQDAGQTASSAVHGAASLTKIGESAGDGINVAVFVATGLSGTQTVTVTYSGATLWHIYAVRLLGTDQVTPCGTPVLNSTGAVGTAVSASVPTGGASDLVVSAILVRDLVAVTLAPDAGQTQQSENSGSAYTSAVSTEPGTGGSVTSGWTWTGGVENRIVVIPVTAAADGPVGRFASSVIARQQRYPRR